MLMSRACCAAGWPQEGVYVSLNADLAHPDGWSAPQAILKNIGFGPGWYPQVLGTAVGETDKLAGQVARLYIHGVSRWELVFHRADGLSAPPPPVSPSVEDQPADPPMPDPAADPAPDPSEPEPQSPPSEPEPAPEPGDPSPDPEPEPAPSL
jgi:hypothetical protein